MPKLIPFPPTTDPRKAVDVLRCPIQSRVKPNVIATP